MRLDVSETGIPDNRKMIISVLRKTYAKRKPETIVATKILIKILLMKH